MPNGMLQESSETSVVDYVQNKSIQLQRVSWQAMHHQD